MEAIRAFVGHSFTDDDAGIVTPILKYLDGLAELHPNFNWHHAEHSEPRVIDAKVLALFKDKNLFIGICTRKERAITDGVLKPLWLRRGLLASDNRNFEWKTSDWIIQEIGLAIGLGLDLVLLVEEGVRSPGGLQGNLERIPFNRDAPEKCFNKLLQMIASLSPKVGSERGASQESSAAAIPEKEELGLQPGVDWTPKPGWTRRDFDMALFHFVATHDENEANRLSDLYLASEHGRLDANRKTWAAFGEYVRIAFGRGGQIAKLQELMRENQTSSVIARYLARSYLIYDEYGKAADYFEYAAGVGGDAREKITWLGEAAVAHQKDGNGIRALDLLARAKLMCEESGQGEEDVLQAERKLAEGGKEDETLIASMERLLDINPSDHDTRFSLAYKYSERGRDDLAAFHYSRIPYSDRSALTWNNLGVSLNLLGLPVKSVTAYRKAEELGETLAMSNLANKMLDTGFLEEAKAICDRALQVKDHHKNVDTTLSLIKGAPDKEDEKESAAFEKVRPMSEFYKQLGRALAKPLPTMADSQWKGPRCPLELTLKGAELIATGSYEVGSLGLINAAITGGDHRSSTANAPPPRFHIEYRCTGRGRAFIGTVSGERDGEPSKKVTSILSLSDAEQKPTVLMVLSDDGREIRVLEVAPKSTPKFYRITQL